jgi:hypothetical protein
MQGVASSAAVARTYTGVCVNSLQRSQLSECEQYPQQRARKETIFSSLSQWPEVKGNNYNPSLRNSAMNTPNTPPTRAEMATKLSMDLTQLRDALVSLSLCLKDWQFELDQNGSRISQKMATQALDKFKLQRAMGVDKAESVKSSTSEGS